MARCWITAPSCQAERYRRRHVFTGRRAVNGCARPRTIIQSPPAPTMAGATLWVWCKMLAPSPSRSPRTPFPESFLVVPVVIGAILSAVILYLVTTGLWLFVHQVLQQHTR